MSFIRNCWYFAAWADELGEGERLARRIIGDPLLFWRQGGRLYAVTDSCPHRLAPLHMGRTEGETVHCGYHGLAFDGATGKCVHNPHGPITGALSIRAYPLVERHGVIWIWMGDADRADPAAIPDMGFIDEAPEHAFSKGYMYSAAGHKLLEDNILDLSHADYLHPATLGGGSITRTKAHVEERGDTLFVRWLAKDERAIPIFRPELPDPDMAADMWTEVLWHPDGVMLLRVGASPAGEPREAGIDTMNAHVMTPETETTTHYFYCNSRNYRVDDADYNAGMAKGLRIAFETEDKPMIEAQQRALGDVDLFERKPALLGIDNGSTRARRIYRRLVDAEAAPISEPV
ncbi:aromatic ring-hydroxylating dioxygenase subunit alpha [Sphingobium sp. 15-1]|uniref:aromatic ring-hydroxylating dioxygenase subunit alpha n=1 Tax=Sphingobium sp. 15-1 TaxID=2729616 RepID=UPI00159C2E8C|nr:aromatic ring-hydroxylating dioxygenase subunit alpha [Sphingobium sp. 15-1]